MSKKIWCMLKKHISTVLNPLKHHGNFWQWNQAVSDMISTYKMETSLTVVIKLWYCAVCVRVCIWWLRLPPHTRTQTHTHTDTHTQPRHRPLGFAAADMKCICNDETSLHWWFTHISVTDAAECNHRCLALFILILIKPHRRLFRSNRASFERESAQLNAQILKHTSSSVMSVHEAPARSRMDL